MTIDDFERRAVFNGGYDRVVDGWKIIDIHIIPDVLELGSEVDFYCSNDKIVYLLRIRIIADRQEDKLSSVVDEVNKITYLIAEIKTESINNNLIIDLLYRFTKNKTQ